MDIQILLALQSFREATGGIFNELLAFITNIAVDCYIMVPALILFWVVDKKKGAFIITSWGTGTCINSLLKVSFCVYRPWVRCSELTPLKEALPGATGYSFPSGHSTSVSGFYGSLAYVYRKYKGIIVFAIIMILLTMFSRNYVGVHTPQDVLVGLLVGLSGVFIVAMVSKVLEKHPNKDWIVFLIATIGVIALLLFTYYKSYPIDYVNGAVLVDPKKMTVDGFKDPGKFYGVILGWFLERRLVKFKMPTKTVDKVLMAIFGSLLFIFMWYVVVVPVGKAIGFGPVHFALQAGCIALFMTVYPLIASKIITKKKNTK